jgi:hypothetical protein
MFNSELVAGGGGDGIGGTLSGIAALIKAVKYKGGDPGARRRERDGDADDSKPKDSEKPKFHQGGLVGKKGGTVEEGEFVIPKHIVRKAMPNALEIMSPLAAVLGHKGGKKAPSAKPEEEEDGIKKANDAIASSKKALEGADKAFPSPKKKPEMIDSAKKPAAKPASGIMDEAKSAAEGIKAKGDAVKQYQDAMPKMHDGGKVKEDGPKNLQKGEVVIPKDKAESAMKELDKKAKGPMASAAEEAEHETPAEEKAEGAKGEAKEGEHKKTSDKHNPAHEGGKKKKVHVTVIHHHKHGHTMHHMDEDGASTMHQFGLGDHAAMGKNIGDMLQANGQGAPEEGAEGGEQGGEPQGPPMQGAPQQ